jgi:Tfp pilus assembly protein PilF|tara:strand:+ start:216 stop:644 length:429 start_codon:yes stop_codon:yes gene_type:complete
MKIKFFIKILLVYFSFFTLNISAENKFFEEGKNLFEKKNFEKARFKFEQDIVRNPKSENSYLYLANIFKEEKKVNLQEQNLKTVILLNPKNETALFSLALLNIEKSNYSEVKKLLKTFNKVCKSICSKSSEIQKKLKNSQNK